MNHPLHLAVAEAIEKQLNGRDKLMSDPACGGKQQLPLFVGTSKRRETRMCCVDLLVISTTQVKVIVEIEESGFLPTKICGKFLQSALATHFIHDSLPEISLPYADEVPFVQVLDASKCLKQGTRKDAQANIIEAEINKILSLKKGGIIQYSLFFVNGKDDQNGLTSVGAAVSNFFNGRN